MFPRFLTCGPSTRPTPPSFPASNMGQGLCFMCALSPTSKQDLTCQLHCPFPGSENRELGWPFTCPELKVLLQWSAWDGSGFGSWWWTGKPGVHAEVHGVTKSRTRLREWTDETGLVFFFLSFASFIANAILDSVNLGESFSQRLFWHLKKWQSLVK